MAQLHRLVVNPPLLNSSCRWASELHELQGLYECPFTGAVTTRTATLDGFTEDESHTVVFAHDSASSLNSYGYSPHPLSTYIGWIRDIISADPSSKKPFILSITVSSPASLDLMLNAIQELRTAIRDSDGDISRIGVELNTSCPNIKDTPPPAYDIPVLEPFLRVMSKYFEADDTLTLGLKLPPYVYSTQFENVVRGLSRLSFTSAGKTKNPVAFLTCTNTLGSSLLFLSQTSASDSIPSPFALAPVLGGLAGSALHPLALGNVYTFNKLLLASTDVAVARISIIGVGGVADAEGVRRMHDVGAKVVGCATILGKEGLAVFERLGLK